MKTKKFPTEPGDWGQKTSKSGTVRYFQLTPKMIERRHALARSLGYTLRNPCSFCTPGYPRPCDGKHQHFDCWESTELTSGGYAEVHHVHDHTKMLRSMRSNLPEGVRVLSWPEEADAAAEAVERRLSCE
jgi:hypothetical protein